MPQTFVILLLCGEESSKQEGFSSQFQCVISFVDRFTMTFTSWAVTSLSPENQLLIPLIKLRHNFTHKHLAFLFKMSVAAISNITSAWIDILHELFFVGVLNAIGIPSRQKPANYPLLI